MSISSLANVKEIIKSETV